MTYDDFSRLFHNHERINKCCLITSNKAFTKGHIERVRFTESVIKYHSDIIDVFGNGYNPISDKLEVLSKYKYALTIENCRYPNYWTEKLSDSFLAECYPIYHGCPNVEKYFPKGSYSVVDINKTDETINTIKQILNSNLYELSVNNLLSAKKLVLDKYNIFTQIAEQIDIIENNRREMLYPESPQITDKIKEMLTRRLNIII